METKNITKIEFETKGKEWTSLDTEYDNLFQNFLDNPQIKTEEEIVKFREMQKRLYSLEEELYLVAEGKVTIIKN